VNDLKTITELAAERKLRLLLIGGYAVIAHGYQVTTLDLDFAIERNSREEWLSLMTSLGYSFFRERPAFLQFKPTSEHFRPVDLMMTSRETFQKLFDEAVETRVGDVALKAVSLTGLVALKCHAIKHGDEARIFKDMDDVINLILANRVKIEDSYWRELILKYGTDELYEKLRRACKG
jgi:hypothetical protein